MEASKDWWFSRAAQKKIIFELSYDITTNNPEISAGQAITKAEQLVNLFYAKHLNPQTRID